MIQLLLFYIFVSHLYFGATIFLWTYKLQSCTVCRCHAPLAFYFSVNDHLLVRFQIAGQITAYHSIIYINISIKIPPMTCPHLGRVTDGIVPFYGYSYVVSGISVSSVRIRLHCKHGSIQPDAILSRTLKGFHGHRRKFLIQS